jgi:integrase
VYFRNFEAIKLRRKHLRFGQVTQDERRIPYWVCFLTDRKGWQRQLNEGDLRGMGPFLISTLTTLTWARLGNTYKIFPQRESPHIDVDHHVQKWLSYLETEVYMRKLLPEDFIFPSLASNASIRPDTHISHDTIQTLIHEFAGQAGIVLDSGSFTTHCYRRGGAQYRFMYAPFGERWTLQTVQWWGGWAEGEQVCDRTNCSNHV